MDLSKSDIDSMQSSHHVWEKLEVTLLIGKPPLIGQGEIVIIFSLFLFYDRFSFVC